LRTVSAAANAAVANATAIESQAGAIKASADWLRERVEFVLQRTTGFAKVDDPELWQKQYNNYHGWARPEFTQGKPSYHYSPRSVYAEAPAPINTTTNVQLTELPMPRSFEPSAFGAVASHGFCFAAGTPILTALGSQPIETLATGDHVLSQDPVSGELAYKPVQKLTLRSASGLLAITTGTQTIQTTAGHPFWVAGQGWQVAKRLKPGDVIHGLHGAAIVDNIAQLPPREVYNLVVSDWHTYFAGDANLLVHDNSPIQEQSMQVPGLVAKASDRSETTK
jgi:hypothetical protein